MADPFHLRRFVVAQAPVMDNVRKELAAGAKRTHWIWYIFPQIAGLGLSQMSQTYALSGAAEARAYLAHPSLGKYLVDCTELVLAHRDKSAAEIFGELDAVKFRSCMTLFSAIAEGEPVFTDALNQFFAGAEDPETLKRLRQR
ncbi:MAG: DUF1810 domain-containing protein [Acidiphilium sp.]|jgi:uncharacterized protein (DUF1810 family)|nr:DUF1810 domain-containing protein [Acidiphilium sp.]